MQTSMRGRPRPVTATVTKPRWMQIPDPDAMAKIRRRSLESNGSTESLTSLLDHDSYTASLTDEDLEKDMSHNAEEKNAEIEHDNKDRTRIIRKEHSNRNNQKGRDSSPYKRNISNNSNLSAWEKWVIHKEKEDRQKRQQDKEKKKEEKYQKDKEQQEKLIKLQKAEVVRKSWTEKKNKEEHLAKKMEKAKIKEAEQQKEKIEEELKQKAIEKFSLWTDMKKKEEKQKKQQVKEESKKIEEHEEKRKQRAEECFQRWLKQAKNRPKSAPNSYGFMSGKVIGYHDRSAYPQPSFVNPVPWQPIAAPSSSVKPEKTKPKRKPYNWNPDKYL